MNKLLIYHIQKHADMVIVDYDVNDGALLNDFPNRSKFGISAEHGLELLSQKIASGTEVLLRWLSDLPQHPAILWIESFAFDGRPTSPSSILNGISHRPHLSNASCYRVINRGYSISDVRKLVLEHYGVPSISLRRAVWPSPVCALPLSQELKVYQCSDTCHHPTVDTHKLLAEWVATYISPPPPSDQVQEGSHSSSFDCCKAHQSMVSDNMTMRHESTSPLSMVVGSYVAPFASQIEVKLALS